LEKLTPVWFHCMEKKSILMEDKRNQRGAEAPHSPEGTSYW